MATPPTNNNNDVNVSTIGLVVCVVMAVLLVGRSKTRATKTVENPAMQNLGIQPIGFFSAWIKLVSSRTFSTTLLAKRIDGVCNSSCSRSLSRLSFSISNSFKFNKGLWFRYPIFGSGFFLKVP